MKLKEFLKKVGGEEDSIIEYKGKEALEAVKRNGDALRYVKEQTEEICLEAVRRNGDALEFVQEQTESICLEAIKPDGHKGYTRTSRSDPVILRIRCPWNRIHSFHILRLERPRPASSTERRQPIPA